MGEHTRRVRNTLQYHQGKSARHDFQRAARHVDCCAERHRETGHILVNPHLHRLPERYGNCGGRRLRSQCGEISRHHGPKHPERILAVETCRYAVLEDENADMQHENHPDDLGESRYDGCDLPCHSHVHENAEDIKRKKWNHNPVDSERHNIAEFREPAAQRCGINHGTSHTKHKRKHQRGHNTHQWRDGDIEICSDLNLLFQSRLLYACRSRKHSRKQPCPCKIANEPGHNSSTVGEQCCGHEHLSGTCAEIGYGRSHESKNDERYQKTQELGENAVEGSTKLRPPHRADISYADTCHNSYGYAAKQTDSEFLVFRFFVHKMTGAKSFLTNLAYFCARMQLFAFPFRQSYKTHKLL